MPRRNGHAFVPFIRCSAGFAGGNGGAPRHAAELFRARVRFGDSGGAHLLCATADRAGRSYRQTAGADWVGYLFWRASHRLPTRSFRIWTGKCQPPICLVLPARASLLQFGAAKPTLRPAGSRAGLRAGRRPRVWRSRAGDLRKSGGPRLGTLSRADARARANCTRDSRRYLAYQFDVSSETPAESRAAIRKTRHRSGALRSARGGVHNDGAYDLGNRAAPL